MFKKSANQKEEKKIPPCPFCGSDSFFSFEIKSSFIFAYLLYRIKCSNPKCKEETKIYHSLDSAIEEWKKGKEK